MTVQEEFWSNLGRYARYFITVLLGTAYTAVKPIAGEAMATLECLTPSPQRTFIVVYQPLDPPFCGPSDGLFHQDRVISGEISPPGNIPHGLFLTRLSRHDCISQ